MVVVEHLECKEQYRQKRKQIPGNIPPELSSVNIGSISVESFLQAQRHAHITRPHYYIITRAIICSLSTNRWTPSSKPEAHFFLILSVTL